jgi:hypothetical protein
MKAPLAPPENDCSACPRVRSGGHLSKQLPDPPENRARSGRAVLATRAAGRSRTGHRPVQRPLRVRPRVALALHPKEGAQPPEARGGVRLEAEPRQLLPQLLAQPGARARGAAAAGRAVELRPDLAGRAVPLHRGLPGLGAADLAEDGLCMDEGAPSLVTMLYYSQ